MKMIVRYLAGLPLAAALALASAAPAQASGAYAVEKIALDGETAPDAGGQAFTTIDGYTVDLNAAGEISFAATLSGALPNWGIFAHTSGSTHARAVSGDPAPTALGGVYWAFGYPYIDDAGGVTFGAMVKTGPTNFVDAVIREGAASDSVIATEGDLAPSTAGTLDVNPGDLAFHAHGASGAPVFRSTVTGGVNPSGIFAGTGSAIALAGAASPAGGTYDSFHYPGGNASGTVAFPAFLIGAPATAGLFVDAGAGPAAIVLAGDLDPDGEIIASTLLPQVDTTGEVMFLAEWEPVVDGNGAIYIHGAGGLRVVHRTEDPVPGTGGATIVSMTGLPHFSNGGRVTFSATLADGDFDAGVFVVEPNGSFRTVARSGDPVPDVPGATFTSFGHAAGNDAGQVAFAAVTSDAENGVFLATANAPAVPALPPAALALLGCLLLAAGHAASKRSAR